MDAVQQPDQGEEPPRKKQRKGASRMKLQLKPVPVAGGAAGGARQGAPEPVSAAAAYVPDGELRAALRQLVTPATVATLSGIWRYMLRACCQVPSSTIMSRAVSSAAPLHVAPAAPPCRFSNSAGVTAEADG